MSCRRCGDFAVGTYCLSCADVNVPMRTLRSGLFECPGCGAMVRVTYDAKVYGIEGAPERVVAALNAWLTHHASECPKPDRVPPRWFHE